MTHLHAAAQALVSPFSLGREAEPAGAQGDVADQSVLVVEAIEPVEIEYAALRRSAVVLDRPERGVIEVRGSDRLDFLNRMLTQELRAFEPGVVRRALWLNRKGRIDADLVLVNLPDRLLMETDVFAVEHTIRTLREFVFAEDIEFLDVTETTHRLSIHGPAASRVLSAIVEGSADRDIVQTIAPDRACAFRTRTPPRTDRPASQAGGSCVVWRTDSAGEIGLELLLPAADARTVYTAVSAAPEYVPVPNVALESPAEASNHPLAKRAGWHAFNIARIETGTPLFRFDFGSTNLPHELGRDALSDRVSFKKGCYLGQEVVARMESLGHPKQRLVALRFDEAAATSTAGAPRPSSPNPLHADLAEVRTGSAVVERDEPGASVVGAITSAAMSPMLGGRTLAFAMVRWSHAQESTRVWVQVGGGRLAATVGERLRAWPK